MRWTEDQEEAIGLRNHNILVSAAAGSGKTAVLVERIVQEITDPVHPADVDRLLVVTFTRAAAAQMKERIEARLEELAQEAVSGKKEDGSEQAGNPALLQRIERQLTLLHKAHITTIDSFCLEVVRSHFHEIGMDPGFRVADEAELTLLQQDVLNDVLEEEYTAERPDFLNLVESYTVPKSDAAIETLILRLYTFSQSYPWPEQWLDGTLAQFACGSMEEMAAAPWMQLLLNYLAGQVRGACQMNSAALQAASEENGPDAYLDALEDDRVFLGRLAACSTYGDYAHILGVSPEWQRLKVIRNSSAPDLKEYVKSLREHMKKIVASLHDSFFFQSPEEMLSDLQKVKEPTGALIRVTKNFAKQYAAAKAEKNLVDFSDLEHRALEILVSPDPSAKDWKDDGFYIPVIPTAAALEYRAYFEEILIDEYQDSNLIQDFLLRSISRETTDKANLFMVGDVKQSIYKFRLARPELFMKKYEVYQTAGQDAGARCRKILLRSNFRSRMAAVLEPVNEIFRQVMTKAVGGIDYDRDNELCGGGDYPPAEEDGRSACSAELLLIDSGADAAEKSPEQPDDGAVTEEEDEESRTARELEASAAARKILELLDPVTGARVYDKERKAYRNAVGSDIVILLRTMSGWSETFTDTLMRFGIPAYADTQSGYFRTIEVQTLLSLLSIIDNPRQEIPLAAVLRSPIGGFTDEELAELRIACPAREFYDSLLRVGEENPKAAKFLAMLADFRRRAPYLGTRELLEEILHETGYEHYVQAMPGGDRRRANVEMLKAKASEFEQTGYRSLFQFNRYIERLRRYEVDYGEAGLSQGDENQVRILSIHKSKGLEFPIVILAGTAKVFNDQDTKASLILHPDYGIGPDCMDPEERTETATLMKSALALGLRLDNLGEELRVLYVAMTRAKERLIMTGVTGSGRSSCLAKRLSDLYMLRSGAEEQLPYDSLTRVHSELDLILLGLARNPSMDEIYEMYDIAAGRHTGQHAQFDIQVISPASVAAAGEAYSLTQDEKRCRLEAFRQEPGENPELAEKILKTFDYHYPFAGEQDIPVKVSVSELKHAGRTDIDEDAVYLYEPPVPAFAAGKQQGGLTEGSTTEDGSTGGMPGSKEAQPAGQREPGAAAAITGSALGTVYHRIMQELDFRAAAASHTIAGQLQRMKEDGRLTEAEEEAVEQKRFLSFFDTELGQRMARAEVVKEQPFVIGIPASRIRPETGSSEMVLVQGIIDAFFEEDGELVLVDYKTDHVAAADGAEVLKARYRVQLDYYAEALTRILKKPVKECWIYSFTLGRAILL